MSIYTTIMEFGPKNHNGDGLLGPNSIMVVSMDPLGYIAVSDSGAIYPRDLRTHILRLLGPKTILRLMDKILHDPL